MSRLTVHSDVSALTHVGFSLPVKRKRERTPETIERSSPDSDQPVDSATPSPTERINRSSKEQQQQQQQKPPKKKKKTNRTSKQATTTSRPQKGPSTYLRAIMNGETLPESPSQATAASKARYERLKKHLDLEESGEDTEVDEMQPEFFSDAFFPARPAGERPGSLRLPEHRHRGRRVRQNVLPVREVRRLAACGLHGRGCALEPAGVE